MVAATALPPPSPVRRVTAASVAMVAIGSCAWLAARSGAGAADAVAAVFVVLLSVIAVWDARTMRAPNVLVFPSVLAGLLLLALLGSYELVQGILGGVAAFVVFLVLAWIGNGAMGYGDVKTAAVCGMAVGIGGVIIWLLVSFALGGLVALLVLAFGVRGRKDSIALTPFLVIGVVATTIAFGTYLVS